MIYFISDIHLGIFERSEDKPREDFLLGFLRSIEMDCETLFIAGDLFDFWFDYKTVIPKFYYRTIALLHDFTQKGIKIEYIIGNHDFGHFDFFENELNVRVYKYDIERSLSGKRFYISHGDGKAKNDLGYKIIKAIMRYPLCQKLYRKIHPDCGIHLASTSSKKSRRYTDSKRYGKTEGMEEFAQMKINEGFDYVIMGHRHRAIEINFGKGTYINLGEWMRKPHYAVFDGEELKLVELNPQFQ